ncbi:MAG: hydrogenase nickel incorporation protein HypB [Planctomycetota bacterium]|jgi:hydrogenase nickel incorporation protein HypB
MCETCGCGDPEIVPVEVKESLLKENDHIAGHNREHFEKRGVCAINLMGSPGSGKTALLEATARAVAGEFKLAAVSGDLATDRDAERLAASGITSRAITTGTACHLDARLVHHALHEMSDWGSADFFFIENVGNLVCPSIYDLGEKASVVAISVTEGDDKPLKYPVMFRDVDLVLLTKVDLLPHCPDFSVERFEKALATVMGEPHCIQVCALSGEGIPEWVDWLSRCGAAVPHS